MAFKPYSTARVADIKPGDTLESIAARERAQGNNITAQDIAKFNWGTDNLEYIQELLRDELGAIQRSEPHDFLLSSQDSARSKLKIPEPFHEDAFGVDKNHTLHVRRKRCPKQFLTCAGLPSFSFDFDSSFLRPDAKKPLKEVQEIAEVYSDCKLFVFGHTDAVGDDLYNKKLSERRAWCVYSFLIKDPQAWESLYNHPKENWGVAAIQEILAHLGHEPGTADGDLGPKTRAAIRRFLDLPDGAPVKNDTGFRLKLFEAYMNGPDDAHVPKDRFCGDGFMGCGEFNLAEVMDNKNPENRRVVVFAFNQDRLPNFPCVFADISPCQKRISETGPRYNPGFFCSFYDTVAEPCHAENEHHSVSLLIRKYPVTSKIVNLLMDEYELLSTCGKLGSARKATSASTRDEKYLELTWEHVRSHMVLTLVHKLGGDGKRILLSEVPFMQLHNDGHIARNEGAEDLQPPPKEIEDADMEGMDQADSEEMDLENAPWEDEY
jgi:hypothetical protein